MSHPTKKIAVSDKYPQNLKEGEKENRLVIKQVKKKTRETKSSKPISCRTITTNTKKQAKQPTTTIKKHSALEKKPSRKKYVLKMEKINVEDSELKAAKLFFAELDAKPLEAFAEIEEAYRI